MSAPISSLWLSPDRQRQASVGVQAANFEVIEQPSPQRDVSRFQQIKQNLQEFRAGSQPNTNSNTGAQPATIDALNFPSSRTPSSNNNSVVSGGGGGGHTSQQQSSAPNSRSGSVMKPPTLVQAEGAFRSQLPTTTSGGRGPYQTTYHQQQQQQYQQQQPYHLPPPQTNPSYDQSQQQQQQQPQTVLLRSVTGNVPLQPPAVSPVLGGGTGGVSTTVNTTTNNPLDDSTAHNQQHNHHHSTGGVGRSLFAADGTPVPGSSATPPPQAPPPPGGESSMNNNNNNNLRRVATQERPPWIGPMDSTPTMISASGHHHHHQHHPTSTTPRSSTPGSKRKGTPKGSRFETHHIQDGRKIVFRGNTRARVTEESLYTGQSKVRFAWKQVQDDPLAVFGPPADDLSRWEMAPSSSSEDDGSEPYIIDATQPNGINDSFRNYKQEEEGGGTGGRSGSISARKTTTRTATGGGGAITPIKGRIPPEPLVLNMMSGTSQAADQMRRARTEGERRTAETLMRREAWKALHPGAMDWGERKWEDNLRAGARSARGGAPTFDDAKHFTMFNKQRPMWRFPAAQGPTMTELREAPVVVSLSLEDLNVSATEQRVLDHIAQVQHPPPGIVPPSYQKKENYVPPHQSMSNSSLSNQYTHPERATTHRVPVVERCDEPPPSADSQYVPTPVEGGNIGRPYHHDHPHQHHRHHEDSQSQSQQQQYHHVSRSSLPPEAARFGVGKKFASSTWSASPVPVTPPDTPTGAGASLGFSISSQQQQQQQKFVLPSKAAREAMSIFGDPNKSIRRLKPSDNPVRLKLDDSSIPRESDDDDVHEEMSL